MFRIETVKSVEVLVYPNKNISNKSMFFEEFALKRHVSKFPINGKNQR